jgi:hypothetical protein
MGHNMKIITAILIVLLTIIDGNNANSADINISNINAPYAGFETLPASNIVKSVASSFTTASIAGTTNAQLVELYLSFSGTYDLTKLSVQIFTDSFGAPGTPVGSTAFSPDTSTGTTPGVYRFTNTTNPTILNSNSNYWVVVKNIATGGVGTNLNWGYTTSSTPVAGTNGSIGTNGSVFTGTATWSNRPGSPFLFAVSSTVPEPSTYMFGATSILILAFTKKRRKNIERRLTGSV